ncbi:MAG: D-alanyl-D-alanine carboxypeptidase [Oscillospiraceae bacterium]|nr:D-alanyl-D-alanine carboxypeptidase [Oscillospiraceae bacterium]
MKKTVCLILTAMLIFSPVRAKALSAESYTVVDADTGETLYSEAEDRRMAIASITKIMTALVALERGNTDDEVKITDESQDIEGTSMYLKAGDRIRLEELIYGMMLVSGNDAASAVAIHIGGDEARFTELMNEKAEELGAVNTSFANPHGLSDEKHYSTARDMAIIATAAMKNEDFARIVSTKSVTIGGVTYKNHNKLLWMYDGVIGVKTGYTKAAGRTLVSCCERDGLRLICVTLDDPDDWDDHIALYDRAFSEYKRVKIIDCEADGIDIPVISGGDRSFVTVKAGESVSKLVSKDDKVTVYAELPRFVYAGFKEGDRAGTLYWSINGKKAGEAELVFSEGVRREKPGEQGILDAILDRIKGLVENHLNKYGYYGS